MATGLELIREAMTNEELFRKELPAWIADKAIANSDKVFLQAEAMTGGYYSALERAIDNFNWEKTPEGHKFWLGVYRGIHPDEPLPSGTQIDRDFLAYLKAKEEIASGMEMQTAPAVWG